MYHLGDNCIQSFHLWRYIVFGRCASGPVKHYFRTYIQWYTSTNEIFEYGYSHSNALLQSLLILEHCTQQIAACHPTQCEVINDVKLFPTVHVYHRIYCCTFLTLSNQTSHYKSKCIRIIIQNQPGKRYLAERCVLILVCRPDIIL